jgi:hypothetical protein
MLAVKGARDGIHHDREGGDAPQAAGLSHRADSLPPAIPRCVGGARQPPAPEHGTAEGALGAVGGGRAPCVP